MATNSPLEIVCSQKSIRSLADLVEQICQIKKRSDGNFFLKGDNEHFFVMTVVIEGLIIWGSKCHQNNSQVVSDGYVKYDEADV